MTPLARWRRAAALGVAASALLVLWAARWASARSARGFAQRAAASTAAYLALIAPRALHGADYDLPRLLIEARALEDLPGLAARLEIYRGTAPLVHATAQPLTSAGFQRLRRQAAARWERGAVLAPLFDRDGWEVVGGVEVRPPGGGRPSLLTMFAVLLSLWAGALAAAAVGGARDRSRRALARYAPAAALLGLAAFSDVRGAARDSTNRWLGDARLLMQEAVARLPELRFSLPGLAAVARGAELVPGDSAGAAVGRRVVGGAPRAAVAVRLGRGRWAQLRAPPAEAGAVGWLGITLGLALLGPLAAAFAAWGAREAARPQRRRETVTAWGFLAPSALHLAVFSFAPILFACYLSVHRWTLVEPTRPFVGLANFAQLLREPLVWISLRNTALYALYVPVSMALALAGALMLNQRSRRARALRAILCLPSVCSVVAVALVWQWMYHADSGLINHVLSLARLGPVDWLGDPRTALAAVMVVSVWVQLGYQMTVFLAGLQGIPREYLDAARVDGANAWHRFWKVTFPLLTPVTLFVLVTGIIASFQLFTFIYVLTDGGPLHATDVLVYRLYQTAWEFLQFGYASALSLVLFVALFGATWAQFRLLGKHVEYA